MGRNSLDPPFLDPTKVCQLSQINLVPLPLNRVRTPNGERPWFEYLRTAPAHSIKGRCERRCQIQLRGILGAANLARVNRAVVRFYNKRGTAEQWIKEGKQAVKMTRLSCHRFRTNQVRLWLSLIAYNLGNLWRRLALPEGIGNWSLTSLQQRLVKTGGRNSTQTRLHNGRVERRQVSRGKVQRGQVAEQ
jgi:Transposase DDE domain group 1